MQQYIAAREDIDDAQQDSPEDATAVARMPGVNEVGYAAKHQQPADKYCHGNAGGGRHNDCHGPCRDYQQTDHNRPAYPLLDLNILTHNNYLSLYFLRRFFETASPRGEHFQTKPRNTVAPVTFYNSLVMNRLFGSSK